MTGRTGPFWDGVEGRAPVPAAARTLGFEFLDADPEAGTIELAFTAVEAWTNPAGNVLGAFVAAMLYDTVGPALLATLEPDRFQATEQLTVLFRRPLRPGRVLARGRVVHRVGDTAVLEASLHDPRLRDPDQDAGLDDTIATATATARVIPLSEARDAV